MAFNKLSYSKDWSEENTASSKYFATYESSESQVRADAQLLYNEIQTWANDEIVEKLADCSNIGMGEASSFTATDVKGALVELKNSIVAASVPNYSLTTTQMSRKSVEGTAAVGTDNIANDAVTGALIADDAVDSEHITDGAIEHAHLATYTEETAANAPVGTTNIQTGAVTNSKIANYAIAHNKLATVSNPDGAAVDVSNIVYKTITRDRLAAGFGATMTVTSSAGKAIFVPDTFLTKVSEATGTYTFTYNGSGWTLSSVTVALSQYGITTSGTFTSGDTIVVVVAATTPAVGTDQIGDLAVTNDKLAGSIDASKLAGSIPLSKLASGYIIPKANGGTGINASSSADIRTELAVTEQGKLKIGNTTYDLQLTSDETLIAAGKITFIIDAT